VGLGFLMLAVAAWAWWLSRRRSRWRIADSRFTLWVLVASIAAPFGANTCGWLFTEMGRQPWIVYGLMKTSLGISPTVGAGSVIATLAVFVVLYSVLGVIDVVLMSRAARASLPPGDADADGQAPISGDAGTDTAASLVYWHPLPCALQPERAGSEWSAWTGYVSGSAGWEDAVTGQVAGLNTAWFSLIGLLWTGYFVLEGFDFGVGILAPFVSGDDVDRRLCLNSIGPFWDGNEVWLIVAGGAMFAAFPTWYATMFSGFYLALFLILVALIVRGVAFEFRAKQDAASWRRTWDVAMFVGSLVPALLWGVAFTDLVRGVWKRTSTITTPSGTSRSKLEHVRLC